MDSKPTLDIPLTFWGKILEGIGWILLFTLWGYTLLNYKDLPDTIPTHYNGFGEVNAYGKKATILVLPIIGTLAFGIMTFLMHYPHKLNYPTTITVENVKQQYTNSIKLLQLLKLTIIFLFLLIVYKTIQTIKGLDTGLGVWFLPFSLAITFIPIIWFAVQSTKLKR